MIFDMNTDQRRKAKNYFEKDFYKTAFGKSKEDVRKHKDIKLVTTEGRTNYLVSEPDYHTTKFCSGNLLAIKMKKHK